MKAFIQIQLLILISLIGFSCQNQKTSSPEKADTIVAFEDGDIKAQITEIEVEGNILKANLVIKNKNRNDLSFRFDHFVFTCGEDYGIVRNKMYIKETGPWKIPNYENLNEEEQRTARKERMVNNLKELIKSSQYWNSELTLKPNEKRSKKIELEFKEAIKMDEVEFYFDGQYKKLLNI